MENMEVVLLHNRYDPTFKSVLGVEEGVLIHSSTPYLYRPELLIAKDFTSLVFSHWRASSSQRLRKRCLLRRVEGRGREVLIAELSREGWALDGCAMGGTGTRWPSTERPWPKEDTHGRAFWLLYNFAEGWQCSNCNISLFCFPFLLNGWCTYWLYHKYDRRRKERLLFSFGCLFKALFLVPNTEKGMKNLQLWVNYFWALN